MSIPDIYKEKTAQKCCQKVVLSLGKDELKQAGTHRLSPAALLLPFASHLSLLIQ